MAEGCVLRNDIAKGQLITCDDVILPEGRLIDQLRREQEAYFDAVVPTSSINESHK